MFPIILIIYIQVLFFVSNANTTTPSAIQLSTCRTERRTSLHYDNYKADTCARCYLYMPDWAFSTKFQYRGWKWLRDPRTNLTHEVDPHNVSQVLLESFSHDRFLIKWKSCCLDAWQCCDDMLTQPLLSEEEPYCPRTWDGWQCWPDTPAGSTAKQPCKDHVYFHTEPHSCTKFAVKTCWPNGTWYQIESFKEWTNYSNCGRVDDHKHFLYYHMGMFVVSIVFMIPALIIFMTYKQLQVHRITMHKNFFLSLFFNGIVGVLTKAVVIMDVQYANDGLETVMDQNGAGCKILFTLAKYFRMTTYMWMFCEGFYLHKLIAAAFAEQKNLLMFYIIGWVLPVIPVVVYAILRLVHDNERCWAFPEETYEWIMNAPNLTSLVVNLFFLCNIIRVLVTKLRATHANEPSQYRKAVRATLVLVPLFGLHFCLVIYRPTSGACAFIDMYNYFNYTMDGLQGLMVALIFCYLNGEVISLLWRSIQRRRSFNKLPPITSRRRSTRLVSLATIKTRHVSDDL